MSDLNMPLMAIPTVAEHVSLVLQIACRMKAGMARTGNGFRKKTPEARDDRASKRSLQSAECEPAHVGAPEVLTSRPGARSPLSQTLPYHQQRFQPLLRKHNASNQNTSKPLKSRRTIRHKL
ncbi:MULTISPECIES: hypothetical protein [Caballeronia]|uniref:hypothetical protein n=1 Tax=Caballeronia TaxID=1827195 RepID=UPI0012FD96B3|nr:MULTISPECIES: hypothetical protein [Caballeronia]